MDQLANWQRKAAKISKAVINAATHPDHYQTPPGAANANQPLNQTNPNQPPNPYQPGSSLSPQFQHPTGQQPGTTWIPPQQLQQPQHNAQSYQDHPLVAPPAPYGSPAYQSPSTITPSASTTNSTPHPTSGPPPFSPIPNHSQPYQQPTYPQVPISQPQQAQFPTHYPIGASPWMPASPHPVSQVPTTGIPPSPAYNSTTPTYHDPQYPQAPASVGTGTPAPAHNYPTPPPVSQPQTFASPILAHRPAVQHANSYPGGGPAPTPPQNSNIAPPPSAPVAHLQYQNPQQPATNVLPQAATYPQYGQAFIAELPADEAPAKAPVKAGVEEPASMPIELPAELPADLPTTKSQAATPQTPSVPITTQLGQNTIPSSQSQAPQQSHYPSFSGAAHPTGPPPGYPPQQNQNPDGMKTPAPLHTVNASINSLEEPKPVHPESSPAATAHQIASITPISPPPLYQTQPLQSGPAPPQQHPGSVQQQPPQHHYPHQPAPYQSAPPTVVQAGVYQAYHPPVQNAAPAGHYSQPPQQTYYQQPPYTGQGPGQPLPLQQQNQQHQPPQQAQYQAYHMPNTSTALPKQDIRAEQSAFIRAATSDVNTH